MPKVSSYAPIAAADIAPAVDSLYIVDASATGSAASREVTALELFRANLSGTVQTLGDFTLSGGNARAITFSGFTAWTVDGVLNLKTPFVTAGGLTAGMPVVLMNPSSGNAEWGMTSDRWVVGSVETITTGRTLSNDDHGKTLYYTGTANITLTVPSGLASGFRVRVVQGDSGKVTFAGSGVTISGKQGQLSTGGQWHVIEALQLTSSQYVVHGDTAN